jgi:hypothetical protein
MVSWKDWLTTFWKVLIHPLPKTFVEESHKAKDKLGDAILWLELGLIFTFCFNFIAYQYVPSLFIVISAILFYPIVFLFYVFITNTIYLRLFHRKESLYDEMLYFTAVIVVMAIILSCLLSIIPMVGSVIDGLPFLYALILLAIAIKTLSTLKLWESIVTVVLSTTITASGFVCIIAFVLSLMNTIPNVF